MSLVGHYKLDEGDGGTTNSDSVGSIHGTLTGGKANGATRVAGPGGQLPYGRAFDGANDYVDCSAHPLAADPAQWTLACWYKMAAVGAYPALIGDNGGTSNYVAAGWFDGTDPFGQIVGPGTFCRSASSFATGTWRLVIFGYDGTTARLFVNGTQVQTASPGGPGVTNSNLRLAWNSTSQKYNGAIADVRLYDHYLDSTERASLRAMADPVNLVAPSFTTTPTVDQSLTVDPGTWGDGSFAAINWSIATESDGSDEDNLWDGDWALSLSLLGGDEVTDTLDGNYQGMDAYYQPLAGKYIRATVVYGNGVGSGSASTPWTLIQDNADPLTYPGVRGYRLATTATDPARRWRNLSGLQ